MKERPILFNAEMVRAVLNGRKTQTRRRVWTKQHHPLDICERPDGSLWPWSESPDECGVDFWHPCPYGQPGDRIWVRESIYIDDAGDSGFADRPYAWHVNYSADGHQEWRFSDTDLKNIGKKASIHMPRWASRITLEVTNVRVERVQEIGVEDALAEGIQHHPMNCPRMEFAQLWNSIHGDDAWERNDWVWVVEFKKL